MRTTASRRRRSPASSPDESSARRTKRVSFLVGARPEPEQNLTAGEASSTSAKPKSVLEFRFTPPCAPPHGRARSGAAGSGRRGVTRHGVGGRRPSDASRERPTGSRQAEAETEIETEVQGGPSPARNKWVRVKVCPKPVSRSTTRPAAKTSGSTSGSTSKATSGSASFAPGLPSASSPSSGGPGGSQLGASTTNQTAPSVPAGPSAWISPRWSIRRWSR